MAARKPKVSCPPRGHADAPHGGKGACPVCSRPRCHGKASSGTGRCRQFPIRGGKVCRSHGGAAGQVKAAAEKRVQAEKAAAQAETFGLPVEIDPGEALLAEVHRTQGHVSWLARVVAGLEHGGDGWIRSGEDDDGNPLFRAQSGLKQRDTSGKFEKASVWVELYQSERKHLTAVCKAALDAGVAQARLDLARQHADQIGSLIDGLLRGLGHDPEDAAVRQVVHRQLTLLQGGAAA